MDSLCFCPSYTSQHWLLKSYTKPLRHLKKRDFFANISTHPPLSMLASK